MNLTFAVAAGLYQADWSPDRVALVVYRLAAENRLFAAAIEDRVMTAPPEARILTALDEARLYYPPLERRVFEG